jgi:hypothetical protein
MSTMNLRDANGLIYQARVTVVGGETMPNVVVDGTAPTTVAPALPTAFVHMQPTIGTTAVRLTATVTPVKGMPIVKADPANTGIVYVINSAAGTIATGFPLSAGDVLPVSIDDLSKLYFIASAASQKVAVVAGV